MLAGGPIPVPQDAWDRNSVPLERIFLHVCPRADAVAPSSPSATDCSNAGDSQTGPTVAQGLPSLVAAAERQRPGMHSFTPPLFPRSPTRRAAVNSQTWPISGAHEFAKESGTLFVPVKGWPGLKISPNSSAMSDVQWRELGTFLDGESIYRRAGLRDRLVAEEMASHDPVTDRLVFDVRNTADVESRRVAASPGIFERGPKVNKSLRCSSPLKQTLCLEVCDSIISPPVRRIKGGPLVRGVPLILEWRPTVPDQARRLDPSPEVAGALPIGWE